MPLPAWRAGLIGAVAPPVLILAAAAGSMLVWPDWPGLRTLARMAESLAPQMILAASGGLAALAALRAPRAVLALAAALILAAAAATATRHLALARPVLSDRPADLVVLWFNVLTDNATPPDRLAAALAASGADIVVLAEAAPLADLPAALAARYPVRAGCETGPAACQLMVLARDPGTQVDLRPIGRTGEARLAVIAVQRPGGGTLSLVAMHLFKPWFFGIAEAEDWQAVHALRHLAGPTIAMGDLNAAPWSRRVRFLAGECGLAPPRLPRPTWPAGAGWLGVPIDHVLVRGGARLASLSVWGTDLGSNHAGLLAGIALPAAEAAPAPPPAACKPPRRRWDPAAR